MIGILIAALVAALLIRLVPEPTRRWTYTGLAVVLAAAVLSWVFPASSAAVNARRAVNDVWLWATIKPAGTTAGDAKTLCGQLERDQLAVASARRQVLEAASSRGTLARSELEEYFGLLERLKSLNALCQERVRGIASPQEPVNWSPIFVIGLLSAGSLSVAGILANRPHWRSGGIAIAVLVAAAWIYYASATAAAAPPPRPLPCPTGTRCFSREEAREIIVPLGPEWSEWYLIRMPPGGAWGLAAPNGTEFQTFGGKEVILFERWDPSPMEPHLRFRNSRGGSATFRAK